MILFVATRLGTMAAWLARTLALCGPGLHSRVSASLAFSVPGIRQTQLEAASGENVHTVYPSAVWSFKMSGVVHFKFKSSTAYDSVGFDGAFVSVGELKALIAEKKGLSKDATSELLLSDPRTQAEYNDDTAMVPKSSSVLVRRVPNLPPVQLQQQQPADGAKAPSSKAIVLVNEVNPTDQPTEAGEEDFGGDLYSEQRDEDAALTQLLNQAGQNWEKEVKSTNPWAHGRGRGRDGPGRGFGSGRGRGREAEPIILPKGYICYRCGQQGHHISDCPTNADPDHKRIRPAVGIPSVLLTKDKGGGLLLPDGTTGSLQPNEDAFLRETVGMPGAKPKQANGSAEAAAKEGASDEKAVVVFSEAGPALAGGNELALPMEAPGLLLPPSTGLMPWDAAGGLPPFLPGMGLPGMGPSGDQPLSKEEFLRMKEGLRRKQESNRRRSSSQSRSRSRSRSRHSDRRRRGRDSRSPRRRDSPRRGHRQKRHRSRDRSHSRERRSQYPARRRSPSPGFIQLRKRSRSPVPRRLRPPSPSEVVQLRPRNSQSPPRRRARPPDLGRFDAKAEHRAPASKHPMSRKQVELAAAAAVSNFKAPELLDDTTSFFDEPADLGPPTKPKQASGFLARSPIKQDVTARVRKESKSAGAQPSGVPTEDAAKQDTVRDAHTEYLDRANSPKEPQSKDSGDDFMEDSVRPKLLPKTFSVPVEEDTKAKKAKKSRKNRDKDKERSRKEHKQRHQEELLNSLAEDLPERSTADTNVAEVSKNLVRHKESSLEAEKDEKASKLEPREDLRSIGSSERLPHGPLFLKALTEASGRPKAASKAEASRKVQTVSTQDVAGPDEAEAAQAKGTVDEDAKRKKEHKHKHKSKKRHKEKQAKQDK